MIGKTFVDGNGTLFVCIDTYVAQNTRFYLLYGEDWNMKVIDIHKLIKEHTLLKETD